MKRISLSRRNALLSPRSLGAGAIALLVAVLAFALRGLFPDTFLTLVEPFAATGAFVAKETRVLGVAVGGAGNLVNERDRLLEDNLALTAQNQMLAAQVASLSALLGDARPATPAAEGLVLSVVMRPPESPYDSLVVAGGSAEGVARGMEAFGNSLVPIGTVESVSTHFSRITLFSSPGTSLAAWVGANRVPLTLSGAGAGAFTANAPRAANIAAGDPVYAGGPGALPVGVVRKVGGDPASPVETIYIAPAANPFSLTSVVVRAAAPAFSVALTCATST